jgi:hypothetical protein
MRNGAGLQLRCRRDGRALCEAGHFSWFTVAAKRRETRFTTCFQRAVAADAGDTPTPLDVLMQSLAADTSEGRADALAGVSRPTAVRGTNCNVASHRGRNETAVRGALDGEGRR